ncbi:MAG: hypothetical protein HY719_14295, partial [Planctomycetes bacterium]|nr:hypothetical protein [Planctomycetota bacterium]
MSHQPVGPAMAPSEAVSRRMIDETAVVLGDRRCGQFYRILRLKAPDLARLAHDLPGAFVMLDVADPAGGLFPLLRRPFTFLDVSDAEGWIDLLYQVVGQGTARMAAWPA